jgi:PAS domain S-box/PAS domain S-box
MFTPENLLNSMSQAVIASDAAGMIAFWNRAAEDLYGWSAQEVIGRPLREILPEDDPVGEQWLDFDEPLAGRARSGRRRVRHREGTLSVVVLTASPVRDVDGGLAGLVAVAESNDRRAAEEQLQAREARLLEAYQIAQIACWEWHIASDAIEGTAELLKFLSLDASARLTLTEVLTRYIHPEDRERLAGAFQRACTENASLDVECRLRTLSGTESVLHVRGHRVVDDHGQTVRIVGVIQNITERRRRENRLLQAERVSSLGRLAASVAHEFNNVLMGIQPFVDLLSRRAGADSTVALAAPRIADAVMRGKRITQEMLRFTRIGEPARSAVNVAEWLRAFESELVQLAGQGVVVTIEAQPSLMMFADARQLRQVFANLVLNAHHAMPDGGRMEIRATGDTMRDRDDRLLNAVHFLICDTGAGMPQETLRYIFEPLFAAKTPGGTGLGLAIASQIVQQHDGQIYAESEPGEGTTFHILIPAAEAAQPVSSPTPLASHPRDHALRPGTRLTLIEDDDSVGTGLCAILDLEGIAVDWVRLGRDAVERIAANLPDAVILDVGLADVDGIEVYGAIAARWPDLPVLFSTGHGDEKVLTGVLSPHVGYLQKPYELDALLAAVAKVLRK